MGGSWAAGWKQRGFRQASRGPAQGPLTSGEMLKLLPQLLQLLSLDRSSVPSDGETVKFYLLSHLKNMLCPTPKPNSVFSLGFWLPVQADHSSPMLTHPPGLPTALSPAFQAHSAVTSPTPGWSHLTSLLPKPATELSVRWSHALCRSALPLAKPLMLQGPRPVAFL